MRIRLVLAGLIATMLHVATAAAADPVKAPQSVVQDGVEGARETARRAASAYDRGQYRDAIDLFLQANELAPHPAFSYNIAVAYEDMGDAPSALRWFRDYLRKEPAAADRAEVQKRIARHERKLQDNGRQQVTVLSEPAGAIVVVDGRPVGLSPWTGELGPGRHRVTLQLDGYAHKESEFELIAHEATDVSLRLERASGRRDQLLRGPAEPDVPRVAPGGRRPGSERTIGALTWTALGLGAASLGGAVAFEFARQSADSRSNEDPTETGSQDWARKAESRRTTSWVLAGIGGALATVGGVRLVLDLSAGKQSDASLTAGCHRESCAVGAVGRF